MTNAEARFKKSLRPRKPEGSLGRTAQDVHLDSHTAPELWGALKSDDCLYTHTSLFPPPPPTFPGLGSSVSIDCSPFLPSTLLNSQYGIVPLPCPTYWPLELWIKNSVCMCVCVCVWGGGGGAIYLYMYSNPSTPHPPLPPRQVSSSTPSHQPSYLCLWPTYGNVFTSSSAGHSSSLETNSYENKGMSQAKQWDLLVSEFTYPLCNHN